MNSPVTQNRCQSHCSGASNWTLALLLILHHMYKFRPSSLDLSFFHKAFLFFTVLFLDSKFLQYLTAYVSTLSLYHAPSYIVILFYIPYSRCCVHIAISKIFVDIEYCGENTQRRCWKCCVWCDANLNFLCGLELRIQVAHFLLEKPPENLHFSKEL